MDYDTIVKNCIVIDRDTITQCDLLCLVPYVGTVFYPLFRRPVNSKDLRKVQLFLKSKTFGTVSCYLNISNGNFGHVLFTNTHSFNPYIYPPSFSREAYLMFFSQVRSLRDLRSRISNCKQHVLQLAQHFNVNKPFTVYRTILLKPSEEITWSNKSFVSASLSLIGSLYIFGIQQHLYLKCNSKIIIITIDIGKNITVIPANICTFSREDEIIIIPPYKIRHKKIKSHKVTSYLHKRYVLTRICYFCGILFLF